MTESDQPLIALERCVGADAFGGENYPEVPCSVQKFDLLETVKAPSFEEEINSSIPIKPPFVRA